MHFVYLQDDFRVNDRLTLNLGLRYEYATPMWEENNVLSNYDPVGAADGALRKDGSIYRPRAGEPGSQQLRAPARARLHGLVEDGACVVARASATCTSTHRRRRPAADQRPAGDQRRRQPDQPPPTPSFRPTETGYPAGFTDPSRFNPLASNITYIPADYRSARVQSWFASVQREFGPNMLVDVAYVGNQADESAC